ncbi:unnamed protein product [Parnassius apollo]|uniref:(apollo) hypothetical protein n=1 Tax=Parnassius apollo TaxID=110799 RepID=A0A8S3XF67_PARAO|nr:unnamed protein product [Parnassius apollo]
MILNNNNNRNGKSQASRAEFLYKLSLDLMLPYIKDRLKIPNLRHKIRDKIESVISEHRKLDSDNQGTLSGTSIRRVDNTESLRDSQIDNEEGSQERATKAKQGRCGICKPKGDKKFTAKCSNCSVFICKLHRSLVCVNYSSNILLTKG